MTEIINLRIHRKAKAKKTKEKTAAQNRQKFGRTKAEKDKAKLENERAERLLKGHEREKDEE